MNKKYTFYIILVLALAVVFGITFGPNIENYILRTALGMLQVVLNLAWIIVLVVMAVRNNKGNPKLD